MSLDAAAKRRYARQLLLPEVGEEGQERLSQARFRAGDGVDARSYAVAAEYLARAGCAGSEDGRPVALPSEVSVDAFAGRQSLRGPAAAIVGAFAAVEHLKRELGIGTAGELPEELRLSADT